MTNWLKCLLFVIIVTIVFAYGYSKGSSSEKIKQLKEQNKIQIQYQQELSKKQIIVNKLEGELYEKTQNESATYSGILNQLHNVNHNLSTCNINANSLRELYKAAKLSANHNNSTSTNSTREFATESTIVQNQSLNCRDLSENMVNWGQMYFHAREIVMGWQQWYNINFKKDK